MFLLVTLTGTSAIIQFKHVAAVECYKIMQVKTLPYFTLMFISNIRMGKVILVTLWHGSWYQILLTLIFHDIHTTMSSVYTEWYEKRKRVDERDKHRMARLVWADRKVTVTHILVTLISECTTWQFSAKRH